MEQLKALGGEHILVAQTEQMVRCQVMTTF